MTESALSGNKRPAEDSEEGIIDVTGTQQDGIGSGYTLDETTRELHITNTRCKKLEKLEKAVNLEVFVGRQNLISVIEGLDSLTKLKKLDLADNQIKKIENLNLPSLTWLDISWNNVHELENFSSLRCLRELYLVHNKIKKIAGLESLTSLTLLELGDNRISEIGGLDHLVNLSTLWLGKNKISEIKGLDTLKNLKTVSLQSNRITELRGLDSLSNLEELYLNNNGISKMQGLEKLSKLRILDLASNQISKIEGVSTLSKLEELWIDTNKLSDFQDLSSLHSCPLLHTLYIHNNPLAQNPQYRNKVLMMLPNLKQLDNIDVVPSSLPIQSRP